MTDKQIATAIDDLLENKTTSSTKNLLSIFQKLNVMVQKSESFSFERHIHKLITTFLERNNPELQISALCTLITCLQKGLFKSSQDLDVAYLVIEIAQGTRTEHVEHQELWLKAFTALEGMDSLHKELYITRTLEMVQIMQKVIKSVSSSLQKMSALKMLNILVLTIGSDISNNDTLQNTLLVLWVELICPMVFNLNQPNLQTCALEVSYSSLVFLQGVFLKQNNQLARYTSDIKKNYLPVMTDLVARENCLYSKLWIFLTRLLGGKFHQGFPLVNMLLQVVEAGFKSQNIEVRIHAFYCWQSLIEGFTLNPSAFFTEKRIRLLVLPLKANNGKTEALVEVKFLTWCKLLNALHIKNINFSNIVIDQYLQFCFGPLCEQALISWSSHGTTQISQGKKFSGIHPMSCKAYLQLFGIRKYIDEELNSKLKYFKFDCPKINVEDCSEYSKLIVDSVGECCVMLSQLQNSDRFECAAINEALWKSLFYSVDALKDDVLKQKYTEEISALILALAGVARKRSSLITFGLVPLFNILTSGEFKFFKNEKMTELLFIPMVQAVMKKDKALLQHDVVTIFRKIFEYKRNEKHFLKFVQMVLERNAVVLKETILPEKLAMLHKIWFLLEEELQNYLLNTAKSNIDDEYYTSAFCEFFVWPISTLHLNFNQEELSSKWKNLYDLYSKCTSGLLQNKLAVRIMKNLEQILSRGSHIISVAEITHFIIHNLKLSDYSAETAADVSAVFSILKTFLMMENVDNESLHIFQNSVRLIFSSSKNLIYYPFCLLDPMLDCLGCLLSTYNYTDILEDVKHFLQSFKYDVKFKPALEKLSTILDNSGVEKKLITNILINISLSIYDQQNIAASSSSEVKTKRSPNIIKSKSKSISDSEINSKKGRRKCLFKSKETPEISSITSTNKIIDKKSEKQERVVLMGHDIETMTPVPLRGTSVTKNNDEILVNTPYKFDPKKLTKSQREKLSKRRDDIPAMYQDLSQSQTRDFFSNSNSILESNKSDTNQTKDEQNIENSSNPFSELIKNVTETEKKPTESSGPETIDIVLPTNENQPKTVEIKQRRRRKSVNETPKRTSELNSIENMKDEKKKLQLIPELNNSIDSEPNNPLNTANLQINSEDLLNSGDIENVPLIPEKRRRGRKAKQNSIEPDVDSRPAKIARGRRKSTGSIKKAEETIQSPNYSENESDLDIVRKQQRVNRELQRIKMDINHSDEFYKSEKRKTRMSCSFHNFLEAEENDLKSRKNTTSDTDKTSPKNIPPINESEPIIDNSKEPEPEINIKQCKVPVLYPLEEVKPGEQISLDTGNTKMDVVKGPELTSPFKIVESVSIIPQNSSTCKQILFSPETSPELSPTPKKKIEILSHIILRTPDLENSETKSINSEILAEINAENPEIITENDNLINRKVILDSLTENSDIVTSPICTDTPTRNKELLKNTLEISPIKNLSFEEDTNKTETITSPELVSCEASSSGLNKLDDAELVRFGSYTPHPIKVYTRKPKPQKHSGGRSAKMMDLISATNTSMMSPIKHKKELKESKITPSIFSPSQNRIMKMMGQLEKNDHQEQSSEEKDNDQIRDEDILTFRKEVPSPYASPSCSILKKRKISEDADDNAIRVCKRRRVNFCDPPVSCRKFIEKNAKLRYSASLKLDFIPQESRVTRSSKGTDDEILENIQNDITPSLETTDNSKLDVDTNENREIIEELDKIDDNVVTNIPDDSLALYTLTKQNGDYQKSCEVSVITKNNENSVKSESLFSEASSNDHEVVQEMPSTSRCTSESVLKWSPSKVKNSILNVEILGGTIRNVICTILAILHEKKCDVRPLVKLFLGEHSKMSNILIKEIVRFIAKRFNHNFVDILKHFNSKNVCQSLVELATNSQFSDLIYKQNLCEMFFSIIENPNDIFSFLSKLSIVELGGVIIRRMENKDDTSEFLKQIYDSVPCDLYLKPVPKELLPKEDKEETDDEIAQHFILRVENGNISEKKLISAMNSIMKKFDYVQIINLLHQETKRRRENDEKI